MLAKAELVRNKLWGAARALARFSLNPLSDQEESHDPAKEDMDALTDQWAIERDYWAKLELPFQRTMVALAESQPDQRDEVMAAWVATLRTTAWQAFERVADGLEYDPRKLKAAVRGRSQLAMGLNEVLGPV